MSQPVEPVSVFGLDITSAPRKRKPITVAMGHYDDNSLSLAAIDTLLSLDELRDFIEGLEVGRPSIRGFDFPFGQPRRLVENLGWPTNWSETVRRFGAMTRPEFVEFLKRYRTPRPAGDKQHLRETDKLARGCSPMMLCGVPVGRMYHAVAPMLEKSPLSIPPCRPTNCPAVAIEAYPALIARHFGGGVPYKTENRKLAHDPLRRATRERILDGIKSKAFAQDLGFRIRLPADALGALDDPSGDRLDAISCAVAAAWAWSKREQNWGLQPNADPLEGAIADPTLLNP